MLSDDGAKIVQIIFDEIEQGLRVLPIEISLKSLEEKSRVRAQNIGMAFSPYIEEPLLAKGIIAKKCGSPVRIELKKKNV
jgi:hypothetical protein